MPPDQLTGYLPNFTDQRFKEMFFRYRARNFPEFLQPDEITKWRTFCINRITGVHSSGGITLEKYLSQLSLLRADGSSNLSIINDLETFALDKMRKLEMPAN
jgi:exodeoxyribonuclease-1